MNEILYFFFSLVCTLVALVALFICNSFYHIFHFALLQWRFFSFSFVFSSSSPLSLSDAARALFINLLTDFIQSDYLILFQVSFIFGAYSTPCTCIKLHWYYEFGLISLNARWKHNNWISPMYIHRSAYGLLMWSFHIFRVILIIDSLLFSQ